LLTGIVFITLADSAIDENSLPDTIAIFIITVIIIFSLIITHFGADAEQTSFY